MFQFLQLLKMIWINKYQNLSRATTFFSVSKSDIFLQSYSIYVNFESTAVLSSIREKFRPMEI